MNNEKEYFVIRRVGCGAGQNTDIIGITDDEEYAKSRVDVFTAYEKVKFIVKNLDHIVKRIAENYHDREVMSIRSSLDQEVCDCCKKHSITLVCVENDNRDFSKDKWVCSDCYNLIATYWKNNHPKKICPI